MIILFINKLNILMLIKWSSGSPQYLLIIEPKMTSIFWAHRPISFEFVSLWYPFLDPHLTTYVSNTGVQIIAVLELGTSTLLGV